MSADSFQFSALLVSTGDAPRITASYTALTISKRAGPHAHVADYGRRGAPDTRRDLDAISDILESRDRVEIL
eukprot:scaffold38278_cov69-Phaeocystis_antarctica.AAC.2